MAALLLAVVALGAYTLYGALWRLYLSPIAHIPGPKLAALTLWYEFYYDVILGGQYTFKIIELHKQYGPIIRISPWEVHVADPDFYSILYASSASGQRRNKYQWFTDSFGLKNSVFGTWEHEKHKIRRGALGVYFSMQSVRRLDGLIRKNVRILLERFAGFRDTGEVMMMSWAFAAFTNDVVMTYSFARCDHRLEAPDFDPSYRDASFFGSTAENFMKHAPWLNNFMQSLPDSVASLLHPAMASFIQQKRNTLKQIADIHSGKQQNDLSHPTIFHSILNSKLPPEEKSVDRLSDDAQVLMMAGTLTTAWALEVIMFWLITLPETLKKLKDELKTVMPSKDTEVPLPTLEALPYLNAVMKEGIRLTYGVSCRLARSDPDNVMVYTDPSNNKEWRIPPNTPVGMTSVQIHHMESLFPDSKRFYPERWLTPESKNLEKYIVSFTAGSRQCLGINLAHAELYLSLSSIWRRWGSTAYRDEDDDGVFELYKTGLRDVEIEADAFLPLQQKGTKGIRVRVFK
ncbi:cytochrome P450 monooxygenase [Lepidopterella palustris CBS 459.81]|uniref:Cytochrome P450 monooxygenase n=1 Tax=Lepidopterella palustris CBS 459.81 TaxID=1314670 RepID=A0A8E2JGT3_9PEZI|nr:cytochrome P450 monooxygenase [Lepidopterella palustris CBS 459.81]